ncbi:uncharacterized protein LOC108664633 [Hyalella azteca]|uniref:Uncharacterized protein LOC108664633 n=1 Tax=Hyalella azteca TaxID=294128 RepID=A0A8B7MYW6_HYAAZ|nr:uncharacterized protein LOC108664633 [Hyalella azteca]
MDPKSLSAYTWATAKEDRKMFLEIREKCPLASSFESKESMTAHFKAACLHGSISFWTDLLRDRNVKAADFRTLSVRYEDHDGFTKSMRVPFFRRSTEERSPYIDILIEVACFVYNEIASLQPKLALELDWGMVSHSERSSKFGEVIAFTMTLSVMKIPVFLDAIENIEFNFKGRLLDITPKEDKLIISACWKTYQQVLTILLDQIERVLSVRIAMAVILHPDQRKNLLCLLYTHYCIMFGFHRGDEDLEGLFTRASQQLVEEIKFLVRFKMCINYDNLTPIRLVFFLLNLTYNVIYFSVVQ